MRKPGVLFPGSEPGDFPTSMVHGLIREGVTRCVGGKNTEGICCKQGMTSAGLPLTRPLYLHVNKEAETEQFGMQEAGGLLSVRQMNQLTWKITAWPISMENS